MKCVVINLADQKARWESMASQFADCPYQVERFDAVAGTTLNAGALTALYSPHLNRRQYHQALTGGEIGCYASHAAVWRALLASGEPWAAIFEDDVTLGEGLLDVLRAAENLGSEVDLIKLVGRRREHFLDDRPLTTRHRLIRYRRVPSSCAAYLLSRRGAEKLLAAHIPFGRPVDVDMRYWWESGCRVLGVLPYPVSFSEMNSSSTIGDRSAPRTLKRCARRLRLQLDYMVRNWFATRITPNDGDWSRPATGPAARCR